MTRVGVILASVRQPRRGEAFARWVVALLKGRPDVEPTLVDLKDWPLPAFSAGEPVVAAEKAYGSDSVAGKWGALIKGLDAFVLVTPEYNRAYPAQLKNALDCVYTPWNYKPVAILAYGGSANGMIAAAALQPVLVELRMVPIRDNVGLRLMGLETGPDGFPAGEFWPKRVMGMLDELLWWSGVLQPARAGRSR